jgi:hypothetical protein
MWLCHVLTCHDSQADSQSMEDLAGDPMPDGQKEYKYILRMSFAKGAARASVRTLLNHQ